MVQTLPALIALREQMEIERRLTLRGFGATGVLGHMRELVGMGLIEYAGVAGAMGLFAAEARVAAIAYMQVAGLFAEEETDD